MHGKYPLLFLLPIRRAQPTPRGTARAGVNEKWPNLLYCAAILSAADMLG
jgi:hypothetical protein